MGDPGWLEVLSRALARGEVPSRRRLFKLLGALAAAAAIGRAPRAAAAATTAKKSKRRAACTPGIVQSATLVDAPSIGAGLRLGGFSGLASLDPSRGLFLSVT